LLTHAIYAAGDPVDVLLGAANGIAEGRSVVRTGNGKQIREALYLQPEVRLWPVALFGSK
jgi:hypothetical protein